MRVRDFVPPLLVRALRRLRSESLRWSGDFATWDEASGAANGYDAPAILERIDAAVREVLAGRAAYERDGVAFREPEARIGLLTALLLARTACDQPLRVIDWGGSLASSWVQHRRWLGAESIQRWSVIEQTAVAQRGRELLADSTVSFHTSLRDAAAGGIDLILWGAALQYLPDPHRVLAEGAASDAAFLCFDRLAVTDRGRDRLTVQHVPRSIYPASYPAWFFDANGIACQLHASGFTKIIDWPCADEAGQAGLSFVGQLWRRK